RPGGWPQSFSIRIHQQDRGKPRRNLSIDRGTDVIQNIRKTHAVSNHLECPHFRRTQPLSPFSILDVERGHIPAIDVSLRIEQRVVADQEPAIFAILTQHTLLIFERYWAEQRLRALLA